MNRVREVRRNQNLTQKELSELAKVRQSEISLIENDLKVEFSLAVAKRIALALDKSVDYLWPGPWPNN